MEHLSGSGSAAIRAVRVFHPEEFHDDRGTFRETFRRDRVEAEIGESHPWEQDNHAWSRQGVVRGIHYQTDPPQGKIVSVLQGRIFDAAVDLRRSSPTFGQWVGKVLSRDNGLQMWIPPGFGHGYAVLSNGADVLYKSTAVHNPATYHAVRWNDPEIGIDWQLTSPAILSARDSAAPLLSDAIVFD
ncbi:MAG: dTDP-4-dehydrorhamnose 3,5-epimerase [Acidimicrobiia bacterium]